MPRFVVIFSILALYAAGLAACAVGMNAAPASQVLPTENAGCPADDGYGSWLSCGR